MRIQLTSEAFQDGQVMPRRYTADGEDLSPPLAWANLPAGTKELVLIVEDPDAPRTEPFVHWVIYKIRPEAKALHEGVARERVLKDPAGSLQGKNSMGQIGYNGPSPPPGHGVHHYHFRLYALDQPLNIHDGLDHKAVEAAMAGHALEEADLVGTYERKK